MSKSTDIPQPLSKWPLFDLVTYGRELGLDINEDMARQDLVEVIRGRQELILDLDESALREVLSWAGVAMEATESKEQLARKVVEVRKVRYKGLSTAGLYALARLRSIEVDREHERNEILRRLKRAESVWQKLARKRRRLMGALIAKAFVGKAPAEEESRQKRNEMVRHIKDSLEEEGVVGGLAGQLKSAADDYVAQKLDQIDHRIDQKLDDIDRRLAEWRDREVATRLRIIKITLLVSVLVALLSLGYTALKHRVLSGEVKPCTKLSANEPKKSSSSLTQSPASTTRTTWEPNTCFWPSYEKERGSEAGSSRRAGTARRRSSKPSIT